MVSVMSLLVPILVSAVVVFLASSVIHMLLPIHKNDYRTLPQEAEVLEALRRFKIPPGDYMAPRAGSPDARKRPELVAKMERGPILIMTVAGGGSWHMGQSLGLWFVYSLVVSLFAGYVAGRALTADAHYLAVFRFVGTVAFAGYSLGLAQFSIWYKRQWGTTIKSMIDGLVYALLTAGVFGWLWP